MTVRLNAIVGEKKASPSNNPLVTVVIPCYNAERWISEAIISAVQQTYCNTEIVVIDDGSTDNSLNVIKSCAEKTATGNVRWITGPRGGPSVARNKGLSLARGEWIQFLDADDELHRSKILLSLRTYALHPDVDFVWAPHTVVPFCKSCIPTSWGPPAEAALISNRALDAFYAPALGLFRSEFLTRVGKWNESLTRWVDLEYHARIAASTNLYARLSEPLYFYRQHSGERISNSNRNYSAVDKGIEALLATRRVLSNSQIPIETWKDYLYPSYIHLARSSASAGDKRLFIELLRESAKLRKSNKFSAKCALAQISAYICGVKFTSTVMEHLLHPRNFDRG